MLDPILNSTKSRIVKKTLDAQMMRVRVISNNIANVNTPGFQRSEVKFEDELRRALHGSKLKGTGSDDRHIKLGKGNLNHIQPKVVKPVDASLPSGVNNVDIDAEMSKLAGAQIMYNYGIKFSGHKKINAAIQGKPLSQ